ncbi:MAG: glycosyltransferase family 4 protein [Acidobacteriota bacterium]
MARIGIDGRSLKRGPAGIATYVRNLLANVPNLEVLEGNLPRNNFLWNQLRVPPAQILRQWDVYHASSYTAPLVNFCPLVVTAPDISYLVREEWYPYRLDAFRKRYYEASLKRADRIVVSSDFSRGEVIRLFPQWESRVRRTYLGVSNFFTHDESLALQARRRLHLPERFLLHVGDIHTRRNVEKLAQAAEYLKMPLVLVGRILTGGEALRDWPYLYSGISARLLKGIYSASTVFVYPSLYEGFGLPVLEAMACGVPVVAANRSSLPEVCGQAAVLVEPEVEPLVAGIEQALSEAEMYSRLGIERASRFSWEKTARATVEIYRELL